MYDITTGKSTGKFGTYNDNQPENKVKFYKID